MDVKVRAKADTNPLEFYPSAAQQREVEGDVTLICLIGPSGALTDCAVESERPTGEGFAEATQKLSKRIMISKKAKDGTPTAGRRFQLKIGYRLPI